jgi:hypothetical protein
MRKRTNLPRSVSDGLSLSYLQNSHSAFGGYRGRRNINDRSGGMKPNLWVPHSTSLFQSPGMSSMAVCLCPNGHYLSKLAEVKNFNPNQL